MPQLPQGIWMWRPDNREGGGVGVAVVTSQAELQEQVRRWDKVVAEEHTQQTNFSNLNTFQLREIINMSLSSAKTHHPHPELLPRLTFGP